ncbi:hypothetical protein DID88_010377 [Monilinia fructigena]|uniref:Elongation factor methyltransferase 7 n=1 Tax=Monilinia fructigena TaxID=38457 RepID=A0A395ICL3_9HELO|nr:hypothetical protein DID88_010377 [Monilinia fructigena]
MSADSDFEDGPNLFAEPEMIITHRHQNQQQKLIHSSLVNTYFTSLLELGAGAGLPSLTCASLRAKKVVVTDYPDVDLIVNLRKNISVFYEQFPELKVVDEESLVAEGYCWGAGPSPLLSLLPLEDREAGFDVLILADLLFNHSEHAKLLDSIQKTLKKSKDSTALVFFTPYRPWLLEKDMAFFDLVREGGMMVEKVLEEKMEKVMFEKDRGDEELRRTVFGFIVKWAEEE